MPNQDPSQSRGPDYNMDLSSHNLPDARVYRDPEVEKHVQKERGELVNLFRYYCQDFDLKPYFLPNEGYLESSPIDPIWEDVAEEFRPEQEVRVKEEFEGRIIPKTAKYQVDSLTHDYFPTLSKNLWCAPIRHSIEVSGVDEDGQRNVCLVNATSLKDGSFVMPYTLAGGFTPSYYKSYVLTPGEAELISKGAAAIADFQDSESLYPEISLLFTNSGYQEALKSTTEFGETINKETQRHRGLLALSQLPVKSILGAYLLWRTEISALELAHKEKRSEAVLGFSKFQELVPQQSFRVGAVMVPLDSDGPKFSRVNLINHERDRTINQNRYGIFCMRVDNIRRSEFQFSAN